MYASRMDRAHVETEIRRAFAGMPRPAEADIAPHHCLECDELRKAFSPHHWQELPDDVLDAHRWDMPLLSADAKQHYLPAWMLRALDDHELAWDYATAVVFALGSDHRWTGTVPLAHDHRRAILRFLDFISGTGEMESSDIDKARENLARLSSRARVV